MIPSQLSETAYAAVIALDWADRQHAWALSKSSSGQPQTGWPPNTPEAIDQSTNGPRSSRKPIPSAPSPSCPNSFASGAAGG